MVMLTALSGTACGADRGQHAPARPGRSATPSAAAVRYDGPRLPGVTREPVWSVPGDPVHAYGVGAGIVVIREVGGSTGGGDVDPAGRASVIDFHDAGSGRLLASVRRPVALAWPDSRAGTPALLIAYQQVTPSDGLSAEQRTQVVEAYDQHGHPLGSVRRPAGGGAFTVVNGWVVGQTGTGAAVVADAAGQHSRTVSCADTLTCAVTVKLGEPPVLREGGETVPLVLGDLAFTAEPIAASPHLNPNRLVATDLTNGRRVWTAVPPGTPPV